jgi:hypothetical protein
MECALEVWRKEDEEGEDDDFECKDDGVNVREDVPSLFVCVVGGEVDGDHVEDAEENADFAEEGEEGGDFAERFDGERATDKRIVEVVGSGDEHGAREENRVVAQERVGLHPSEEGHRMSVAKRLRSMKHKHKIGKQK